MNAKITTIMVAALTTISSSLAESADSPSKPEMMPAATLQEIHRELKQVREELGQALTRIAVVESADSPSRPETTPQAMLQRIHDEWEQEIRKESEQTRVELKQALSRIAVLEQQVGSLKKANAKLEQEVKELGRYRLVPLEHE